MTRDEVYRDMEQTFGLVPTFFKSIPDEFISEEWSLFKKLQLSETHIPNKYKELIGLGLSAVTKCRYCVLYHTEAAKMFGASDEEIEEAVHFAKMSAGWSAYIQGLQVDFEVFRDELRRAIEYAKTHAEEKVTAAV